MTYKKNPGYVVQVTAGTHKDKQGYARHRDQTKEVQAAGKVLVEIDGEKKLINPDYCKVIGYVD